MQQDELYVRNLFRDLRRLAQKETNPSLRATLEEIVSEEVYWDEFFDQMYEKFSFQPAQQMTPSTLEYSGAQSVASRNEYIGVALATMYPCWSVWAKIGITVNELADLPNNPSHPYKEFVAANAPNEEYLKAFTDFVDGYYDRGNSTTQKKMIDAYVRSVEFEYKFAAAIYEMEPETVPPPKFSDLFLSLSPKLQHDFAHYPLYEEIGKGNLVLEKYAVLIQQDHIYLRGFYEAFAIMKDKETDPALKLLLTKDPTSRYEWMEDQYVHYGFEAAEFTENYVREYVNHMLTITTAGTVAEGLASVYPCYKLWDVMGAHITSLHNNLVPPVVDHPYAKFLQSNDPSLSTSLTRMNSLINGYYDRLGDDDIVVKLGMFDAARRSINYEILFSNGIYEFGAKSFLV